jgi:large subunit ribosomal protein L17
MTDFTVMQIFLYNGFFSPVRAESNSGSSWFTWLLVIIIVVLVLFILWRLLASSRRKTAAPPQTTRSAPPVVQSTPPVAQSAPPAVQPAPVPVVPAAPDDLTVIEGIGPKISSLLQAAGITKFSQLAATEVSQVQKILRDAGLPFTDPTTWANQARLAAEGKWDELKVLQDSLKGGRAV